MNDIIDKALKEALKRNDEYFANKRKQLNRIFLIVGIILLLYFSIQFGLIFGIILYL